MKHYIKGNLAWLQYVLGHRENWIIFFNRLFGCGRFSHSKPVFGLGWKYFFQHPIKSIQWIWWLITYFTGRHYFIGWTKRF